MKNTQVNEFHRHKTLKDLLIFSSETYPEEPAFLYKEKKQEIPTSYIKYAERSYLLQKGSALELLQKEINALESVQRELVQNITRARYGLGKTEDK